MIGHVSETAFRASQLQTFTVTLTIDGVILATTSVRENDLVVLPNFGVFFIDIADADCLVRNVKVGSTDGASDLFDAVGATTIVPPFGSVSGSAPVTITGDVIEVAATLGTDGELQAVFEGPPNTPVNDIILAPRMYADLDVKFSALPTITVEMIQLQIDLVTFASIGQFNSDFFISNLGDPTAYAEVDALVLNPSDSASGFATADWAYAPDTWYTLGLSAVWS